jgi:hypothetical protein
LRVVQRSLSAITPPMPMPAVRSAAVSRDPSGSLPTTPAISTVPPSAARLLATFAAPPSRKLS